MSNTISTLLLRNLSDVFGENDPSPSSRCNRRDLSFMKKQYSMTLKAVSFVAETR